MSIIWFVGGFILCLFMPQAVQMIAKNLVISAYNKIKSKFNKEEI